ncbi:hypothetical protein LXA43DRAFT_1064740 [Ganoderma leucocontextum]|nr:hypothetical protein LXA43DRAFT_1064740 [Ganoderma leucocontextum]
MPFANVTRLKRNRGGPPKPASLAAHAKPKPKPADSQPKSADPKPKPKPAPTPPASKRPRVSSPPDTYDENESPPLPSSSQSRKKQHHLQHSSTSRSNGDQRTTADDEDPETAPTPQRPDEGDWPQLVRILHGPASDSHFLEDGWKWIYEVTRKLVRDFPLHVHIERVLINGVLWCDTPIEERPIVNASEYDDVVEDEGIFNLILLAFPKLVGNLQALHDSPSLIKTFGDFITKVNAKVRGDDLVRVNRHIVEALALDLKSNQKQRRGFKHTETGRLLCPIDRLDEFDKNPDVFCQGVIDADPDNDHYQLLAVDWPLAIYRENLYDPAKKLKGLLQSRCCLKVYQIIYLGPAGAIPGYRRGNKGQQPVAKKYAITKATIESIVRSAAIARFALTSTAEWVDRDGDFDSPTFVRTLMDVAFLNPTFMNSLVDWYTTHVFGSGKSEAVMRRRIENSTYGRLKQQKQELDRVPGAWYQRQLGLIATAEADSGEDCDDRSPAPRKPGSEDELEYADNPADNTSQHGHDKGRKRKRDHEHVDKDPVDDDNGEYSGDGDRDNKREGARKGREGVRNGSEEAEDRGTDNSSVGEDGLENPGR